MNKHRVNIKIESKIVNFDKNRIEIESRIKFQNCNSTISQNHSNHQERVKLKLRHCHELKVYVICGERTLAQLTVHTWQSYWTSTNVSRPMSEVLSQNYSNHRERVKRILRHCQSVSHACTHGHGLLGLALGNGHWFSTRFYPRVYDSLKVVQATAKLLMVGFGQHCRPYMTHHLSLIRRKSADNVPSEIRRKKNSAGRKST